MTSFNLHMINATSKKTQQAMFQTYFAPEAITNAFASLREICDRFLQKNQYDCADLALLYKLMKSHCCFSNTRTTKI